MLTYILQDIKSDKTGKLSRWTLKNQKIMKKVHILGVVFHGEEGQHHIQPDPDAASKVLLTRLIDSLCWNILLSNFLVGGPIHLRFESAYIFFFQIRIRIIALDRYKK